jgi:hypothetical protein
MPKPIIAGLASVFVAAVLVSACNEPPGVHPWRDDSIPVSEYGTASSQIVLAANVPPAVRQRNVEPSNAPHVSYQVPHYPLWWEDSFEDQGDNDNMFAWTWQDYFDMPYAPGRFVLNTLAWPVSAVVTLPGTPMVSDGIVGKNGNDAKPGRSPDPTAGLEDFGFTENAPAPDAK